MGFLDFFHKVVHGALSPIGPSFLGRAPAPQTPTNSKMDASCWAASILAPSLPIKTLGRQPIQNPPLLEPFLFNAAFSRVKWVPSPLFVSTWAEVMRFPSTEATVENRFTSAQKCLALAFPEGLEALG